jgi:hypothetical protein
MPIYITETGIADKKDGNRSHMIDEYMRAVSGSQTALLTLLLCVALQWLLAGGNVANRGGMAKCWRNLGPIRLQMYAQCPKPAPERLVGP